MLPEFNIPRHPVKMTVVHLHHLPEQETSSALLGLPGPRSWFSSAFLFFSLASFTVHSSGNGSTSRDLKINLIIRSNELVPSNVFKVYCLKCYLPRALLAKVVVLDCY